MALIIEDGTQPAGANAYVSTADADDYHLARSNAAWAAGAAPLYRGQPGYRPEMDGDGDGVACEPFRRR